MVTDHVWTINGYLPEITESLFSDQNVQVVRPGIVGLHCCWTQCPPLQYRRNLQVTIPDIELIILTWLCRNIPLRIMSTVTMICLKPRAEWVQPVVDWAVEHINSGSLVNIMTMTIIMTMLMDVRKVLMMTIQALWWPDYECFDVGVGWHDLWQISMDMKL